MFYLMIGVVDVKGKRRGKFLFNPCGQVKTNGKGEMFSIDGILHLEKYHYYYYIE